MMSVSRHYRHLAGTHGGAERPSVPSRRTAVRASARWAAAVLLTAMLSSPASAQRQDSTARDSSKLLRTIEVRGSVTGLGQARVGNAISKVDLQLTPSGTSPLKAIERLPGVNMQGADPDRKSVV